MISSVTPRSKGAVAEKVRKSGKKLTISSAPVAVVDRLEAAVNITEWSPLLNDAEADVTTRAQTKIEHLMDQKFSTLDQLAPDGQESTHSSVQEHEQEASAPDLKSNIELAIDNLDDGREIGK